MENIIKFTAIPIYEKYYSEDTNWGCYNFSTENILPQYQISEDISGNKINIGVLAGKMQQLHIGTEYEISATLEFNKKYKNYQYKPIVVSAIRPKNVEDQKKFIKSILTTNQANTLIELYPNIVNDVINGKCDIDLNKTKGIKEYTWNLIKNKIIDNYVISDILIMLQPLGVTYTMIKKLLNNEPNPELLKQKLNDNPYILTEIHGLGFKRVDGLALKLNPDLKVSNKRTYAFLNYYLREIGESNGHTWVTFDFLENAVRDNIIECEELYYKILDVERDTQALLYIDDEKNRIGLKYYRDIELYIFQILKELDQYKVDWEFDIEKGMQQAEKELGFEFSDEQKEIIKESTKHNVVAISGRAGSGKTTISRALLTIYKNANKTIGAAALSAKAAQRITEATGFQASTIHRLLGAKGLNEFTYNFENPLPYDVVLADEKSMNNARITYDLVSAIKPGSRLVISGDCRQLPPIGFGNIFSDILELKEEFNVYELTKVHRQAEKSGILTDANLIREGINPIQVPEFKIVHGELQDMYYMFRDNKQALNDIAIKMYLKSIEEDGLDDVIIITPRKKDCINSTMEINKTIQDKLISNDKPFLKKGNLKFKLGAKVIQRVNNYDKNIFNGEIGYIIDVFKTSPTDEYNNMLTVQYPSKPITYSKNELDQIDLAYAMTVHLCLAKDTMLYSSNGIIELNSLNQNNNTYGNFEIKNENTPKIFNGKYLEKPSHFISNPLSLCKKLTTVKGYNVTATLDHEFQVLSPNGDLQFKQVKDITNNDYLILSKGQNIYGNLIDIPKKWTVGLNSKTNNNRTYKIPTTINNLFSEFLGFMVADGTIFDRGIRLLKRHIDVVERFKYVCDSLFGTNGEVRKNKYEEAYEYEVCSTYIVNFLRNINGIQPNKKYVPDIILQTTKENQCSFLKSLFEDGTVNLKGDKFDHIELSFKDKKLVDQVQLILLNMGIISSVKTYKQIKTEKSNSKYRYILYIYRKDAIKFYNDIGFISKFKNNRLKMCLKENINSSDKLTIPYISKRIRYLIEKYHIKLNLNLYRNMIKTSVKNAITYDMANKLLNEIKNANIKFTENDIKYINKLDWLLNNTYIDKINNIIDKEEETCCLTMPKTHQFIQNGFIGSNCQGSGYKTTIVIIDNSHYILLDSCLLYTAITRAKQRCLLLAEPSAFKKCIVNNKSIERQTWFKEFKDFN